MKERSLLFSTGPACGLYAALRDKPRLAHAKAFLEALWLQYRPYADQHFLQAIREEKSFYQRLWELHLGCTLLHKGYELRVVGDEGPDFLMILDQKKIWIEATAPEAGTGKDAVPPLKWQEAQEVPQEQILLRFTQAMGAKWQKYKTYLKKGIIHPDDCYVIAVYGWGLGHPLFTINDHSIAYIIQAVLPFGPEMAGFSPDVDASVEILSSYREQVKKQSGSPVSTKMFLEEEYAGISALLYSEEFLIHCPTPLGKDSFLYLHNPLAQNKLPRGTFKFCKEYWLEERKLQCMDWSKVAGVEA